MLKNLNFSKGSPCLKKLRLTICIIFFVKKRQVWIWKVLDHATGSLIGWICGDRSTQTLVGLSEKVDIFRARHVFTDRYAYYAEIIGAKALRQGKANTCQIERNNFLQRHWLARFHRRTCVVSRSQEMIDISLVCSEDSESMEILKNFYLS
jgi:insertion element IS1 protein InsB